MFFPKLFNAPGCPAPQQKRAGRNQQKQSHADDQTHLLHGIGSSPGCAFSASDSTASGRLGQRHGSCPDCRVARPDLWPDLIRFKIPLQATKASIAPGPGLRVKRLIHLRGNAGSPAVSNLSWPEYFTQPRWRQLGVHPSPGLQAWKEAESRSSKGDCALRGGQRREIELIQASDWVRFFA